jgi:hypothetical protein
VEIQQQYNGWFQFSLWEFIHTFRLPPVIVTFTNRLVYVILFFARPLGVFFFSWGSTCASTKCQVVIKRGFAITVLRDCREGTSERTFGVWDLTLPARAREPWTLPMIAFGCQEYVVMVDDMGRRM